MPGVEDRLACAESASRTPRRVGVAKQGNALTSSLSKRDPKKVRYDSLVALRPTLFAAVETRFRPLDSFEAVPCGGGGMCRHGTAPSDPDPTPVKRGVFYY